jgi:hypothetical protein
MRAGEVSSDRHGDSSLKGSMLFVTVCAVRSYPAEPVRLVIGTAGILPGPTVAGPRTSSKLSCAAGDVDVWIG